MDVVTTRAAYLGRTDLQLHGRLALDDVGVGDDRVGPDEEPGPAQVAGLYRRDREDRPCHDILERCHCRGRFRNSRRRNRFQDR